GYRPPKILSSGDAKKSPSSTAATSRRKALSVPNTRHVRSDSPNAGCRSRSPAGALAFAICTVCIVADARSRPRAQRYAGPAALSPCCRPLLRHRRLCSTIRRPSFSLPSRAGNRMNLHEYQSKELFAEYGIPVPEGRPARSPEEDVEAAQSLGGSLWVVKAQVHAGGRGKA